MSVLPMLTKISRNRIFSREAGSQNTGKSRGQYRHDAKGFFAIGGYHMAGESIVLSDRTKQEKLVPVVTYVPGLTRHKAIAAWLSFLSVCHNDCRNGIRLPDLLSAGDESRCLRLLDDIIGAYLKIDSLSITSRAELYKTAHKIISGISGKDGIFLKDRLIKICGEYSCQAYWNKFENASCLADIPNYRDGTLSALQLKKSTDFAAVIIALTVLYGCQNEFHRRLAVLEENLSIKYGSGFPSDLLGLYLWPLDFSFAQGEDASDGSESRNEHHALLKAAQSINPDVRVQACVDSLVWSRDIIAWVSDEYDSFVAPAHDETSGRLGLGLINEGGNIITGTAIDKFILVAQGSLSDISLEVSFRYEMDKRTIQTYVLPDGFIWSRNPQTQKDSVLDSIHIDGVINFIPSQCTVDGRPKLIIDPYYHALINDAPDFKRFCEQQSIAAADVVIVDERELYLNLPNFSVMLDQNGEKKFLFNKDTGHTLPRLQLKPGLLVQPAIEITAMASSFGSIRCATNMLPESYVKDKSPLAIAVSENLPSETRNLLFAVFHNNNHIAHSLAGLFVSHFAVQPGPKDTSWEYDEFSRTVYLYLSPDQASDPEVCCRSINERLPAVAKILSRQLGIGEGL